RDPAVISSELSLAEVRRRFPTGDTKHVFVVDERGGLCGVIDPTEVLASEAAEDTKRVKDVVLGNAPFLLPGNDLRTALDRFSQAAQETLPVIDNPEDRRVIGYLSENYALRRYTRGLERHRCTPHGEAGIFSPGPGSAPPSAVEN